MQKIILSTNNRKKLAEIKMLLSDLPIQTIAQSDLNIGEAEEPYGTFLENALNKASNDKMWQRWQPMSKLLLVVIVKGSLI